MKFWKNLLKIRGGFSRLLRVDTVLGPPGDAVMAVIFFLLICIAAGFLIRISSLRKVSEGIDQKLNEPPDRSSWWMSAGQKLDMDSAALNAHLKKLGQGILRRTR